MARLQYKKTSLFTLYGSAIFSVHRERGWFTDVTSAVAIIAVTIALRNTWSLGYSMTILGSPCATRQRHCHCREYCLISVTNAWKSRPWASIHKAVRRLTARSREVSKPRDSCLDYSNRSEIWQASRQQCCRDACQIWEQCHHYNTQSRGFETSRDLAVRRLTA